jgi:hypothetical protein
MIYCIVIYLMVSLPLAIACGVWVFRELRKPRLTEAEKERLARVAARSLRECRK